MALQANHRRHVLLNHRHDAADIDYDNGSSGLTADDVQAAIDELNTLITAAAAAGYPKQLAYAGAF